VAERGGVMHRGQRGSGGGSGGADGRMVVGVRALLRQGPLRSKLNLFDMCVDRFETHTGVRKIILIP